MPPTCPRARFTALSGREAAAVKTRCGEAACSCSSFVVNAIAAIVDMPDTMSIPPTTNSIRQRPRVRDAGCPVRGAARIDPACAVTPRVRNHRNPTVPKCLSRTNPVIDYVQDLTVTILSLRRHRYVLSASHTDTLSKGRQVWASLFPATSTSPAPGRADANGNANKRSCRCPRAPRPSPVARGPSYTHLHYTCNT